MRNILNCFYGALVRAIDNDGVEHSGYMSFMIILSIFPFLIFFLALTSFIGASEIGERFISFLIENMPANTTDLIKARVSELAQSPPQSLLTLAIVGAVWTSSSFVECLRTILNRIYGVKSPPPYIQRRLLSILQFLLISFILSFIIFLLIIIPIGLAKIPVFLEIVQGYETLLKSLRYFLVLGSLFLATSFFYYVVPNFKLTFWSVAPGALLAVFLWSLSGYFLSKYIIYYTQLSVVYGSLGGIIITLLFFYVMNFIFIYGASFNKELKSIGEQ